MSPSDKVRYGLAVVVILVALVGPTSSGGGRTLELVESVDVASRAVRGVSWEAESVDRCDLETVTALSDQRPEVGQFVVISTGTFDDSVGDTFVATRRDDGWICQTEPLTTRLARLGTSPLEDRRFGDETTPAGVFPLGAVDAWDGERVNAFGNQSDPGARSALAYRDVHPDDCWGSTPGDDDYNELVNDPDCAEPDEALHEFGDMYAHAVVIGANLDPETGDTSGDDDDEPPYAAATFLHHHRVDADGVPQPTRIGASLDREDLRTVIRLLDPTLEPHFAIGPTDWLRDLG